MGLALIVLPNFDAPEEDDSQSSDPQLDEATTYLFLPIKENFNELESLQKLILQPKKEMKGFAIGRKSTFKE